jgi:Ulp1 family protease
MVIGTIFNEDNFVSNHIMNSFFYDSLASQIYHIIKRSSKEKNRNSLVG